MAQVYQNKELDPHAAKRLRRLASKIAVLTAAILVLIKTGAWAHTDSVSMLGSLVDSCIDVAASLINLWAIQYALVPPDREHRFGHGKAEALAGIGQAAFVAGSAAFLLLEVGNRLLNPKPVVNADVGITVMIISIALTSGLVVFQRYVVRRTSSVAISADSLHYLSDLLVNLGIIVTLLLATELDLQILDPLLALAIAIFVMYTAWKILRRSFDLLMDREFSIHKRREIVGIAMEHAEVKAVHDLRTRSSGIQSFIQMHLEMDGTLTLHRAHAIADEVEAAVNARYPDCEIIIHQDPEGLDEQHATSKLEQ